MGGYFGDKFREKTTKSNKFGENLYFCGEKTKIHQMREDVLVLPTNAAQLDKGLAHFANDFEDALQYQCAKANGCDIIITNNVKDYAEFCDLPFMSAKEFLHKLG